MRLLALFLLHAALSLPCAASPDSRATEIDWSSKRIQIITDGDNVHIVLHTGGIAGKRLIHTEVESISDHPYTTLKYQIVQNWDESYRTMQNFDVTWTMPAIEFAKLRSERKFYILRCDDVYLTSEEVKEIQKNWKTYH